MVFLDVTTTEELIACLEMIRDAPGTYVIQLEQGATYDLIERYRDTPWALPTILGYDYDITIQGFNATLAVQSHMPLGIFRLGGEVKLHLENLTFANAKSLKLGGAVTMTKGELHLDQVTFLNNQAYRGTALRLMDTDLNCRNSQFVGNPTLHPCSSGDNGATIDFDGVQASLDIRDCVFRANGLGLRVGSAETAKVVRTTFVNNSEGGIMVDGDVTVSLQQCQFRENHADYGGGIKLYQGNAYVEGCTFSNNHARHEGGAVYVSPTGPLKSLQIQDSCFFYNTTDTCAGGIYLGNKVDAYSYVTHSHLAGNQGVALDYAGRVQFDARENVWHGIGGPGGIGEGDGDLVYGKVNYTPHRDPAF